MEKDLSSKCPRGLVLLCCLGPFSNVMLQRSKGAVCCLITAFLVEGLGYRLQGKETVGAIQL